jgi:putative hemolysin
MVFEKNSAARPVDAQAGQLQIRLAESAEEIAAAQALRYRVFYKDMSARPTEEMRNLGRDFDRFDEFCDHLLVIDRSLGDGVAGGVGAVGVVGTYRFMRRHAAERCGKFYTSDEYDISPLIAYPGEIMELGRSCVHPDYRTGVTMSLLWRGITEYCLYHKVELMFGCASLPGTDPHANRLPLAYLHRFHLAPEAIRPRAVESRMVEMTGLVGPEEDVRAGRQMLPPLIKGYLRLRGYVGEGAVIDHEFGTTDVCIVVKTARVAEKYVRHYRAERFLEEDDSNGLPQGRHDQATR